MRTTVFVSLLVFIGCQSPTEKPEYNALATATAMFEAFNQHDWPKMSSYYAEDAEFLDPSLGKEFVKQSRRELAEKYAGMQQVFPDIKDDITDVHTDGEIVVVQFTSHGTSADGAGFQLPIVTLLTIRNGLIVRDATYYDLENE